MHIDGSGREWDVFLWGLYAQLRKLAEFGFTLDIRIDGHHVILFSLSQDSDVARLVRLVLLSRWLVLLPWGHAALHLL